MTAFTIYSHTLSVLPTGLNGQGQLGYGDTEQRGDHFGEMGDNLEVIYFGVGFIPIELVSGVHSNCVLGNDTVKCWGYFLFLL